MKQALAELPEYSKSSIDILLIEDNEGDALIIQEMLQEMPSRAFSVSHVITVEMAEPEYKAHAFNVLLLDLSLPGLSGMEAVKKILHDLPLVPIIVMTGLDDEKRALGAMQMGVQDYIVKGQYDNNILPRAIRYAIERKRFENKVIELINFDQVTGLINRVLFLDRLEGAISLANQNNIPLAALVLSLRRFKDVTATLGHESGNKLLKSVAMRLKECIMRQDAIARLEGDEFILLITGQLAALENLTWFAQNIIDAIERPFTIDDHSVRIGCSIGVATYPACGGDKIELLKHADIALHRAKKNGKSEFQFYTEKLNEELSESISIEKELQSAIKQRELIAHYQPIIDLKNNRVCGVETLIRWNHPKKGFVPPDKFIPLAEKSDLILDISEYMIRLACSDFSSWKNLTEPPFYIAVNLSSRDIQKKDFSERLAEILKSTDMKPEYIALEITEGTLMEDPKQSILTLTECRNSGSSIFVDDFGTGYSSLSYLSTLPLDILKIDRSFVNDILTNKHNLVIATATINLAHALGLQVVAEGIETKEQKELLATLGCDKAQGYYFAKPMPLSELTEWLARREK